MVILPLEVYEGLIERVFEMGEGEDVEEIVTEELPIIETVIMPNRGIEEASDEADIDEKAIEALWERVEPEELKLRMAEMQKLAKIEKTENVVNIEVKVAKPVKIDNGGEEKFYLENID